MKITDHLDTSLLSEDSMEYTLILPSDCQRTLFWLHGYRERARHLLQHPEFERLAEQTHTAILFPDVPDTYYLNQPWNHCYTEDFLVSEFIPAAAEKHHLPGDPQVTFLAGISMGGFGSLLIGSHHPERFGRIACISGAFIIDDLLIGNPEITGSAANAAHFQNLFGDIPSLAGDPARNPRLAAVNAQKENLLPPVYLTCGTGDLLFERNRKLYRQLQLSGAPVIWDDAEGGHEWGFFAPAVSRVMNWLTE